LRIICAIEDCWFRIACCVSGIVANTIVGTNKFGVRHDHCHHGYGVVERDVGGSRWEGLLVAAMDHVQQHCQVTREVGRSTVQGVIGQIRR